MLDILSISLFSVPIPGDATLKLKPLLMDTDVKGTSGELYSARNGNAKNIGRVYQFLNSSFHLQDLSN
jgi:hypothetical protein